MWFIGVHQSVTPFLSGATPPKKTPGSALDDVSSTVLSWYLCKSRRLNQKERKSYKKRDMIQDDQKSTSHSQTPSLSRNLQSKRKMLFFPRLKRKIKLNHFENFLRTLSSFAVKLHCIDVKCLCP